MFSPGQISHMKKYFRILLSLIDDYAFALYCEKEKRKNILVLVSEEATKTTFFHKISHCKVFINKKMFFVAL